MLAANDDLPASHWWQCMKDTYATTQAVAVRRQAVANRESNNLGTLLEELSQDCSRVTEEFWLGLWSEHVALRQMGQRIWRQQFAGDTGTHLDPAIVLADVQKLKDGSARVKRYVDKHLAHSDHEVNTTDLPVLSDVHETIDLIGQVFRRYFNLFTASEITQLEPTIAYDWMAVFRVPWMPKGWRGGSASASASTSAIPNAS
jgi:hypothetical protein